MNLNDIYAIEGEAETEDEYFEALQRAINSGSAWAFQGSYGRSMMDAIESGRCLLGKTDARDYWGNHIPSRTQVVNGTKGSLKFVTKDNGAAYARRMAAL